MHPSPSPGSVRVEIHGVHRTLTLDRMLTTVIPLLADLVDHLLPPVGRVIPEGYPVSNRLGADRRGIPMAA
jgi:hypothetical protein